VIGNYVTGISQEILANLPVLTAGLS